MPNRLEDLAKLALATQPSPVQTGPKMVVAGGRVLGEDVSTPDIGAQIGQGLSQLATGYLMTQQLQRRRKFLDEVHKIMGTNTPQEEKRDLMRNLILQYGDDFGLGIKDILFKDWGKSTAKMYKVGDTLVSVNPQTKKVEPIFSAPTSGRDLKLWKQAEKEVLSSLGGSMWMGLDKGARTQYLPAIHKRYLELKSILENGNVSPTKQEPAVKLPKVEDLQGKVKTASEAVKYLVNTYKMSRAEAIKWLKDNVSNGRIKVN